MGLFSFTVNFGSGCVAPAIDIMQDQLQPRQSVTTLTHLVAVNVLMIGLSNIIWVPLANIFGRRPILILSLLMCVFFSMWCGLANSFNSLLAARTLQGCAFGPADTIAPDVVGEVFFVHQRGRALVSWPHILPRMDNVDAGCRQSILFY